MNERIIRQYKIDIFLVKIKHLISIYYKRHGGYVMIGEDNTILTFLFVMS